MANTDEAEDKPLTGVEDIRAAVESSREQDESDTTNDDTDDQADDDAEAGDANGDDSNSEESSDDPGDKSGESGDDKGGDDSKPDAKPGQHRYTQFAGDGKPETYIANLEKAYENSSSEGTRLHQENGRIRRQIEAVQAAAGKDPELANKLHAALTGEPIDNTTDTGTSKQPSPLEDPFRVTMETEWRQKSEAEVAEFIRDNPEVVSDPDLNEEVRALMESISTHTLKTKRRLMTAGEAMRAAFGALGLEDKGKSRKEGNDTKRAVATTRPSAPRKSAKTGADFTDLQLQFAQKAGLSKEKLEKFAK